MKKYKNSFFTGDHNYIKIVKKKKILTNESNAHETTILRIIFISRFFTFYIKNYKKNK